MYACAAVYAFSTYCCRKTSHMRLRHMGLWYPSTSGSVQLVSTELMLISNIKNHYVTIAGSLKKNARPERYNLLLNCCNESELQLVHKRRYKILS